MIMVKKKSSSQRSRKDLLGIAKLAKLSISTLVKWDDGTLSVKPETELRIFDAANRYYKQEALIIKDQLQQITDIEKRMAITKTAMKKALRALKN